MSNISRDTALTPYAGAGIDALSQAVGKLPRRERKEVKQRITQMQRTVLVGEAGAVATTVCFDRAAKLTMQTLVATGERLQEAVQSGHLSEDEAVDLMRLRANYINQMEALTNTTAAAIHSVVRDAQYTRRY